MSSTSSSFPSLEGRILDVKTLVAHFLLQVQMGHVRTQDREPVPLHFDPVTGTIVPYLW